MYSATINALTEQLKKLPSVGQKTAERFVYHWLKSGKKEVNDLRAALDDLLNKVKSCEICWNFSDTNPCPICRNAKRDQEKICVVAEPQDIEALEKTGEFHGLYHVLRGQLATENGEADMAKIKIKELRERLAAPKNKIKEIIFALNPDLPGETTMMYLKKVAKKIRPELKITRLARGLPLGSDLQYADEITLGSALTNRKEI